MEKASTIHLIYRWILMTLIIAIIISGKPWEFPRGGVPLLENIKKEIKDKQKDHRFGWKADKVVVK